MSLSIDQLRRSIERIVNTLGIKDKYQDAIKTNEDYIIRDVISSFLISLTRKIVPMFVNDPEPLSEEQCEEIARYYETDKYYDYVLDFIINRTYLLISNDVNGFLSYQQTKPIKEFCFLYQNLTTLDLNHWDMSEITSLTGCFCGCVNLITLKVDKWDVSNVTNMDKCFMDCKSLRELDIREWKTSNVNSMSMCFIRCESLISLDLSKWDTSNVTDLTSCFSYCLKLESLNVSTWCTSSVCILYNCFSNCKSLKSLNVNNWDVSNVVDMSGCFCRTGLSTLDVGSWDVSKVEYASDCFAGGKLRSLNMANWDLSNAIAAINVFDENLEILNITSWDIDRCDQEVIFGLSRKLKIIKNRYISYDDVKYEFDPYGGWVHVGDTMMKLGI